MITDYFLDRNTRLDLEGLYEWRGEYEFRNGIDPRAVSAPAAGVLVALIGLVISAA